MKVRMTKKCIYERTINSPEQKQRLVSLEGLILLAHFLFFKESIHAG